MFSHQHWKKNREKQREIARKEEREGEQPTTIADQKKLYEIIVIRTSPCRWSRHQLQSMNLSRFQNYMNLYSQVSAFNPKIKLNKKTENYENAEK